MMRNPRPLSDLNSQHSNRNCPSFIKGSLSGIGFVASVALVSLGTWSNGVSAQSTSTDLVSVYEQAKTYDASYQAARFNLEAATSNVPIARSRLLPEINVGAEAGVASTSGDIQGSYENTAVGLNLRQTVYNRASGKLLDQARIGVQQAEAQYAAIGQNLILRVAEAYFNVLRAQADVEFSQSELQAIRRQREQAERRFDVGLVPITDVRSAQAQYDLAIAQEIAASNSLSTAREALLVISGVDAQALTPLAGDLPLTPPKPANVDAWVERAKEQNLDLVIASLNSQNSATQVSIQRAARLPTLDLVGRVASTTTEQNLSRDRDITDIKLELNLPIYSGGRVNAQVAQAQAESRAAEQNLLAQERTTTQQTRDAYRGVQASISQVKALRQALVSTQKSAEATEAGFRAGTRTSVEVLQALRDTFRAQSDYSSARYDYIINTLNLKAASGILNERDLASINRFLAAP